MKSCKSNLISHLCLNKCSFSEVQQCHNWGRVAWVWLLHHWVTWRDHSLLCRWTCWTGSVLFWRRVHSGVYLSVQSKWSRVAVFAASRSPTQKHVFIKWLVIKGFKPLRSLSGCSDEPSWVSWKSPQYGKTGINKLEVWKGACVHQSDPAVFPSALPTDVVLSSVTGCQALGITKNSN